MASTELDEIALEQLKEFAKPCIYIHRPDPPERTGRSKLGGLPNLPENIDWPFGQVHFGSKPAPVPLHFFAQIDCSELPRIDDRLPTSGMLFFFANAASEYCWEDENPDRDHSRVIYVADLPADQKVRKPPSEIHEIEGSISERETPASFYEGYDQNDDLIRSVFCEYPVKFFVIDSYREEDLKGMIRPHAMFGRNVRAALGRKEGQLPDLDCPQHQMLGHFYSSQEIGKRGDDIVPLLMLSYDSYTGMEICDMGQMHFWITESDLKDRNFDNVECNAQG